MERTQHRLLLNKGKRVLDAWSPANPGSDIPALARNDSNNEKRVSTYYVENGSFLKLRNLQVGYNVPKAWTEKIRMERLRFYLSAQNLLTIKSKDFTGSRPGKRELRLSYSFEHHFWRERQLLIQRTTNRKNHEKFSIYSYLWTRMDMHRMLRLPGKPDTAGEVWMKNNCKTPVYIDNLVISAYAVWISAEDINSSFSLWNYDVRSDDAYKGR